MVWNGKKLGECPADVSMFSWIQFSYLSDKEEAGNDWYNFGKFENIPHSLKYTFESKSIDFIRAPGHKTFSLIELEIWDVINLMHEEDRFHLNPVRWDNVKHDLTEGWCYCPWIVYEADSLTVKLMDGKHRMNALLKFSDYRKIPFAVRVRDVDNILSVLKVEV